MFRLCLAESANSTMISASARQQPKAFAAAGSEASRQGRRDAVPGRSPETPLLTGAASESPEGPVLTPPNSSVKTRLLGGSEDPARARETVNSRTSLSLEQSLFQQAELLPFEHCSSLPSPLPRMETSLRTVKQLPFIFIYLCTITYQFMM